MSYRLLYTLAGLCFAQAAASAAIFVLVLITEGSPVVPGLFIAGGLACGFAFRGIARRQKLLYEVSSELVAKLPPNLQLGLDEGTLTEEEYDEVVEIGRRWA
jgi:hypothetical protein